MRKSDLKTGMVVINNKGARGIVMKGTKHGDFIFWYWNEKVDEFRHSMRFLSSVNEDLSFFYAEREAGYIVEIYEPTSAHGYFCDGEINDEEMKLIWTKPTKMTKKELLDRVGATSIIIIDNNKEYIISDVFDISTSLD